MARQRIPDPGGKGHRRRRNRRPPEHLSPGFYPATIGGSETVLYIKDTRYPEDGDDIGRERCGGGTRIIRKRLSGE